jgi:nicotinamide phosphoribosyltransferase
MSLLDTNIITDTDTYKLTQPIQYVKGLTKLGSYFESRGGQFDTLIWNGLQPLLMNGFVGNQIITKHKINEAEELAMNHVGYFNRAQWDRLLQKHKGFLPLRINALPEGYRVQPKVALMTVDSMDPEFPSLTNHVEGYLHKVWYPTSVATMSWHVQKLIHKFLEKTGTPETVLYRLHDFGYRGVSSEESAAIGGAAHLLAGNLGTDTLIAIRLLKKYYGYRYFRGLIRSIPASEHSTMTSWGRENEANAMENMMDAFPTGYVAIVSDSYDIYSACANILGDKLKSKIVNRNGTVVVRPDSGDPVTVVSKVLDILGEKFGVEENSKGYKVLPPVIRVIQGDGVNYFSIGAILNKMVDNGWSADNITFGMGGALLQKTDRDKQKFAFKACYGIVNGKMIGISKDPITDPGKKSKMGKLRTMTTDGVNFHTVGSVDQDAADNSFGDHLKPVFEMGKMLKTYTYDEVIANVNKETYE